MARVRVKFRPMAKGLGLRLRLGLEFGLDQWQQVLQAMQCPRRTYALQDKTQDKSQDKFQTNPNTNHKTNLNKNHKTNHKTNLNTNHKTYLNTNQKRNHKTKKTNTRPVYSAGRHVVGTKIA